MIELVNTLLPYIPSGAIPLVVCICFYFFIQSKRKVTKQERDQDSQNIHDTLLQHTFEITNLKGEQTHNNQIQEDLQHQISVLSESVAKLSVSVEHFSKAVDELRTDIREMRNER